jgi:endonuclease/exonuclease/phosphatase family metal-dependent hydrolase
MPSNLSQESAWCTVTLMKQDKLLVGCVYRSPTSASTNDESINDLIKSVTKPSEASHVLIMGDFNYPNINWETWTTVTHHSSEYKFVETIKDGFLFQHVSKPTRFRGGQRPSILDLVLTNEEGIVSNLEVLAPLGKSDHGILSFTLHCYTVSEMTEITRRQYKKGNYDHLRKKLNIDWESVLAPFDGDVYTQLKLLSNIV